MNTVHQLAPVLILAFPLLGAVVALFTERSKPRLTALISTAAIGMSFLVAAGIVLPHVWGMPADRLAEEIASVRPITWMTTGTTAVEFGFHIDHLGAALLFMVTLCSTMIHVFSIGYMAGETRFGGFFRWIGFFTFSMLGLVVSDNLLTLYVAWELMGLSSYKLIGFLYHKPSAQEACKKAFMTTRIGDVGMFLGIVLLYLATGTFRFEEIFAQVQAKAFLPGVAGMDFETVAMLASFGLLFGAMGKSAQFPLHVWLPDAMEGPTPVSALIHAATMVAAGVYLVGRMYPLFEVHEAVLPVVAVIGTFTALFAGTIAVCGTDIKKVLAYSTISQLGFMFAGLGAGGALGFKAGLFHLVTHAFFKACLFLGSGSVIHAVHTQEVGQMGGLWRKIPVTFATWMFATLAIAGFPWITSGFYSKDAILLALAASEEGPWQAVRLGCMAALVGGAFLTAAYMMRVTALTFFGKPREQERYDHAHESPVMTIPLVVLAVMACLAGFAWHERMLQPEMVYGFGYFPAHRASGLPAVALTGEALEAYNRHAEHVAHWHHTLLFIAIPAGLGGLALGSVLYMTPVGALAREKLRGPLAPVFTVWKNKYWIDEIYWATFVAGSVAVSRAMAWFDREIVDGLVNLAGRLGLRLGDASGWADREVVDAQFVHGATGLAWGAGGLFSAMQGGRVRVYVYQAVMATAVLALAVAAVYG
ncbi:MAG: NADH-quinone oxidoreductase subunit L [Planctomycetes bacterium]|nr:NADH-quinone oxidoreductase subunit L [Planctomycetota bacterium]